MKTQKVIALLGERASPKIKRSLSELGFEVCLLPCDDRLATPVCDHADMLVFPLGGNVFFSRNYASKHGTPFTLLSDYGYRTIPCDTEISEKYPFDIAFDLAHIGGNIYGNIPFAAEEIKEYADGTGIGLVKIKQGYAKCSTLILGNNAAVTADDTVAEALEKNGINVLKIQNSANAISLDGYDCGFIGGASAVFKDRVFFMGDIRLHPNGDEICNFCRFHGFSVCSLSDSPLTDIGGILFFPPIVS